MLMPSFAEGFGLPVIEALRCGTPVIATDLAVYREVVGDIPDYLPADGVDAWTAMIARYSSDEGGRQRQLKALQHYHAPEWSDHFERMEGWIAEVLSTSSGR
jgi:glycosyltransferase involved in cell wall biosynthesis